MTENDHDKKQVVRQNTETKSEVGKKKGSLKDWGKLILKIILLMIWVGGVLIVSQLFVGMIMIGILGKETFNQTIPMVFYSILSYILASVLTIFIPLCLNGRKKTSKSDKWQNLEKELGLYGPLSWKDIGLAVGGLVLTLIIGAAISFLFTVLFPWFDAEEVQELGFSKYIFGFERSLTFIALVVVAPIVEEIIFRGWLYGKIKKNCLGLMSKTWAIIVSSLLVSILFGVIHGQWNVGLTVFAMSLIMCGLREMTGKIYAGIFLHILKNGLAFFLLYVLGM